MHGAGQGLDHHRVLVVELAGHGVELRLVGHEPLAPAPAGAAAVADLEPGGHGALGDVAAQRVEALGALGARGVDAAGDAAERGLHDHPLATTRPRGDLADHLVAGHERARGERGEVERGRAGDERLVGAADPGEPRADGRPSRRGEGPGAGSGSDRSAPSAARRETRPAA